MSVHTYLFAVVDRGGGVVARVLVVLLLGGVSARDDQLTGTYLDPGRLPPDRERELQGVIEEVRVHHLRTPTRAGMRQ